MNIKLFRDLKIGYKLLILFQFMMIPVIIMFIAFMIVMSKLNNIKSNILLENVSSIRAGYNLEKSILSLKGLKSYYILDGDKKWLAEFQSNMVTFNDWYRKSLQSAYTYEEQKTLSALSQNYYKYLDYHNKIISLVERGNRRAAIDCLLNSSSGVYSTILEESENLISINENKITEAEGQFLKYIEWSKFLFYVIIILFLIFGVILVLTTTRSINDKFKIMIESLTANHKKFVISEKKAAIGEIAAGISHELNNPIGIISGFTDLLANKPELTEDDREIIIDINKEAQRCQSLLKQLLDFAKTPEPCYVETNISELIDETLNLFNNQDKYKNISFNFIPSYNLTNIYIEPFQIKQVLLNMIINACDAVDYKGYINVKLERLGNSVRICIKDNGKGISKENIGKIFAPFFTTKLEGVGLGLAICKDIIEKHNGTIDVESEQGNGTEFLILLPSGSEHES